jgi:CheY-like chemotaxis protein
MHAALSTSLGRYMSIPHSIGRKPRVLVVDDYVDSAESMATLLRMLGYDVSTAYDGYAALHVARARQPDVILLDISMPGLNGYDVARQMRQLFGDDLLLIALTANGFEEDRRLAQEAGFDCHLIKPTDIEELEEILRQLVPTS